MFEEWMAHEHYLDREREIEEQLRLQQVRAKQRSRQASLPMRARLGRWLVASGRRLIESA
jgi:hypothetical protein